jgi:phenylacetate-CoA ligase
MPPTVRSCVPGLAWPGIPPGAGAALLGTTWELDRSQWGPAERLLALQRCQLARLVAHAVAHVPAYAGLPADAGGAERFREWPILSKSRVRADPAALHAADYPAAHGPWEEIATTGSTGEPVRVRQTAASTAIAQALVMREHLLHKRELAAKLGVIRLAAPGGTLAGWGVMSQAFETGPATTIDVTAGVEAQLEWLLRERPAYLLAHPTNLRALIMECTRAGRQPGGLRQLMSYGEMLPADLREMAQAHWGVDVVDNYSCREAGTLAFQCPASGLYHVHAEGVFLEVLRDDGAPCRAGETGRVVITPLHNFAMPLIRYDVGDFAEAGPACECGRALPTLARIVGRVTNMAIDPTGRRYWPGLRASLLTSIAPFEQLRLVQDAADSMELQFRMARELSAREEQDCSHALAEMLGYAYRFHYARVPALERGAGGKYEDFISRLPLP